MNIVNFSLGAISVLVPYGLILFVIDYTIHLITRAFTRGRL